MMFRASKLLLLVVVCILKDVEGSCPTMLKTNVQVERRLLGKGFHRDLETTVYVSSPEDLSGCKILLKDILPSGAYADTNQLKFLKALGGPSFHIPQTVNVETPEHLSSKTFVYLFAKPQPTLQDHLLVNLTIPVHFRYHRARNGNIYPLTVSITVPHPSVLLMCEEFVEGCLPLLLLEPCPPDGRDSCEWLPLHSFSTTEAVAGQIPVGNTNLLDTVLLATTTVTGGAVLLILTAVRKKKPIQLTVQGAHCCISPDLYDL
ncbi:phosphatidylinositol glycan anchor biosynthesis class X [Oratosquilla oratoria]|uniref:phosphatidylinositol glycan anchor biosynthesis class X n=1 Tax=Oratosquilla oratoria TaxID=337810 RepID=UPI003F758F58